MNLVPYRVTMSDGSQRLVAADSLEVVSGGALVFRTDTDVDGKWTEVNTVYAPGVWAEVEADESAIGGDGEQVELVGEPVYLSGEELEALVLREVLRDGDQVEMWLGRELMARTFELAARHFDDGGEEG